MPSNFGTMKAEHIATLETLRGELAGLHVKLDALSDHLKVPKSVEVEPLPVE